jgi:hypothetical protein
MVVVIDGHTSKLHACDSLGLALQRCLFRNGYDLGACAWDVSELEKCCQKYQVPCSPSALHAALHACLACERSLKVATMLLQQNRLSRSLPAGLFPR